MSRKLPEVELFVSDNDPSGYGEGQQFLSDATADGAGNFTLSICGTSLLAGTKVTATATDALGNTSESSLNYTITAGSGACPTPTPSPSPNTLADSDGDACADADGDADAGGRDAHPVRDRGKPALLGGRRL